MPVTDPIADMLTRIRNALAAGHERVEIPHSKIKAKLLELMRREGFIWSVTVKEHSGFPVFDVKLRYYEDGDAVIHGIKRVSKPGIRIYSRCDDIPYGHGGSGVSFISTSKGILTDRDARRQSVGGEILCYIW